MSKKVKPVINLQELRHQAAQWLADAQNGVITIGELKAWTGVGSLIVKTVSVEVVNNSVTGLTRRIDFLENPSELLDPNKPNATLIHSNGQQKEDKNASSSQFVEPVESDTPGATIKQGFRPENETIDFESLKHPKPFKKPYEFTKPKV